MLTVAQRTIFSAILHLPKDRRSTSKFGASSSSHSRLHGQFSVARELMTHGLLHIRYLEKKSLYVTVESTRSIASGTRAFSSTGHKPLSISMNVDMTRFRASSSDLASKLSHSQRNGDEDNVPRARSKNPHLKIAVKAGYVTFASQHS